MRYSIIVPVYNRPDEVDELLESLTKQSVKDFEVIIVEDGSSIPCKEVCDKYAGKLDLHYYKRIRCLYMLRPIVWCVVCRNVNCFGSKRQ